MESLLSAAAIATLVSTIIGGGFNILWSNRLKRNSDISTFRYTNLYKLNVELNSLIPVNYDLTNMKYVVEQSTDRYSKVTDIYNKALPLLEEKHTQMPNNVLLEAEKLSNDMVSQNTALSLGYNYLDVRKKGLSNDICFNSAFEIGLRYGL